MNLAEEARVLDDAAGPRTLRTRTQLDWLESEGVHILREVAGECTNPALLFSGGKDSAVVLRLAEKAFRPAQIPFTIVHIDTGHNFPEAIEFRDRRVAELGVKLVVGSVEDSIKRGTVRLRRPDESRNAAQSVTLLETIAKYGFDACIGGARRDEEKARAKERIFSFRDDFGQWDPKHQRPELWNLYNARVNPGEHVRVFPISTGPSWMSGNTSSGKNSIYHPSISRIDGRCSAVTAWSSRSRTSRSRKMARRSKN